MRLFGIRALVACFAGVCLACDGSSDLVMDLGSMDTGPADAGQLDGSTAEPDAAMADSGMMDSGTLDMGAGADSSPSAPDMGPTDSIDVTTVPPPIDVGEGCVAPPLLSLEDIPDDRLLDDRDSDTTAIFEVRDGLIVSKFVRDEADARGALRLWQELSLRIPLNQLFDLVQFTVYRDTDPVAIFNRRGAVTTERYGLKIGFSTVNFTLNDPDPCARLTPRRGTFDWSLVHEFGHLRGWVDGSWPAFLETFEDVSGPGTGYPEDGSPVLTGDFVTSYAERADGDEDHAESWTTFVMLPELPVEQPNEPLALQKVRWMTRQPDLLQIRKAIRITEPDGGNVTVPGAPRLFQQLSFSFPAWLLGTWSGTADTAEGTTEFEVQFAPDDFIVTQRRDGLEVYRESLKERHESGAFVNVNAELIENDQGSGQVELLYIVVGNWFRGPRMDLNFLASGSYTPPVNAGDVEELLVSGINSDTQVSLQRR